MTATLRTTIIQEPSSATANMTLDTSGGVAFGNAIQVGGSAGTSGQYLKSNGSGASPSWATLSATGALIRAPQILTSGTSYTTPSNCTAIYVEMVGGGGGGGVGINAVSGAGGGAYCAKYFTVTGSTAYTYAIGAGGAGINSTTAQSGNNGGNTTFTVGSTTITAGGGTGGGQTSSADTTATGSSGGSATNGDINISGGSGDSAIAQTTNGQFSIAGRGGNSMFGNGGGSLIRTGSPIAPDSQSSGSGYGGGGVGRRNLASGPSGAGSNGVIRIWEFT